MKEGDILTFPDEVHHPETNSEVEVVGEPGDVIIIIQDIKSQDGNAREKEGSFNRLGDDLLTAVKLI